jgi:hypothetical protein
MLQAVQGVLSGRPREVQIVDQQRLAAIVGQLPERAVGGDNLGIPGRPLAAAQFTSSTASRTRVRRRIPDRRARLPRPPPQAATSAPLLTKTALGGADKNTGGWDCKGQKH